MTTRKLLELTVGAIRHADFGLVAGAVRDRPDETDPFIAEMRDQPVQPAGDRNGVVVEKDDDVAARQCGATVRRFSKAGIGRRQIDSHSSVELRESAQVFLRAIGGRVVHDDDLEGNRGVGGEQALETEPREHAALRT